MKVEGLKLLDIGFKTGAAWQEITIDVPLGEYNLFYAVTYLDTKPKARSVNPAVKYSATVAKPQFIPGKCYSE